MIAMMIIMILTNKEWCRFIANNVVQEPLSLKLPACSHWGNLHMWVYVCVCVYGCCHLLLWLKIKLIVYGAWPTSGKPLSEPSSGLRIHPSPLEESRTSRDLLTPRRRLGWFEVDVESLGPTKEADFLWQANSSSILPGPHPSMLSREGHCREWSNVLG